MLIDSHAHLDMRDFKDDRSEVINSAVKGGLTHIITIGIDLDSSRDALELAEEYDFIYASAGVHPHNASACDSQTLDNLARIASNPKVIAWGETGLDFFRLYAPKDDQFKAFRQQLEIANDMNLPIIIHNRDAHDDVLKMLKKMGKGDRKGVIHCFSGDQDLAAAFIKLGYYISIPGTVTYKKATKLKEVASSIPIERMLIETDAPFLAPVPKRGKRNEPLFVTYTGKEVARLRNTSFKEVARQTAENAKILFGLL